MTPLLFIGSRSHMGDIALTAEKLGYRVLGILDHQYHTQHADVDGIPVIGDERWLLLEDNHEAQNWKRNCYFFVATLNDGEQRPADDGSNRERLRYERIRMIDSLGLKVASLIDPDSGVHRDQCYRYSRRQIGRGVYLAPSADIAVSVSIGDWCVIERHTFIGHHCTIGCNTAILPTSQLANITIGSNSCIGYGASTRRDPRGHHYHIGDWSTIWSHAEICQDVPENSILTDRGRIMRKFRSLSWTESAVDQ